MMKETTITIFQNMIAREPKHWWKKTYPKMEMKPPS
jgi:hypothetical protein